MDWDAWVRLDWLEWTHAFLGEEGGEITWWQMTNRAFLVFIYGVFLVRLAGRRVFGQWAPLDIVVSLVIGSNLSRALTGNAPLAQTLIASTLLVILHAAVAWLIVRFPSLSFLFKGRSVRLVKDGVPDERALRRNGFGPRDFEEALRIGGVRTPEEAESVHLERNGKISVIKPSAAEG